ncbi:hypothetical protein [Gryllotalpicola sp.]|uniref:hypothetical protein n=1 Tax=Gryllotalpicola sp. TaxID=1932787 RepID=UPI002602702B|nr:hypothetical protein [Gryllotalpicola sp.]
MADTLKAIEQLEAILSAARREPRFSDWIDPDATARAQGSGAEPAPASAAEIETAERGSAPEPAASPVSILFDQLIAGEAETDAIRTTDLLPEIEPEPDDADEIVDDVEVRLDGEFTPLSSTTLVGTADSAAAGSEGQSGGKAKKKRLGKRS